LGAVSPYRYLRNSNRGIPESRRKVKALSLHHRFVIALHSPAGVVETGERVCPPEKKAPRPASGVENRFSLVRFEGKNRRIAAIFRDFQSDLQGFLRTSDLLVERVVSR